MGKRILIVHGYRMSRDALGPLNEAVARTVAAIAEDYDHLLLPCGWHDPTVGERPTIADALRERLVRRGVDRGKLHTQFTLEGLQRLLPARNTQEEVVLAGHMARVLGLGADDAYEAVAAWFMVGRVSAIHAALGSPCRTVHAARGWGTLRSDQFYHEPFARLLSLLDPSGLGRMTRAVLASRTVVEEGYAKPDPTVWRR